MSKLNLQRTQWPKVTIVGSSIYTPFPPFFSSFASLFVNINLLNYATKITFLPTCISTQ